MTYAGKTAILAIALAFTGAAVQAEGKGGRDFAPLTKAEAIEKAVERFETADVDGNGILTGEELRKGAKKMRDKLKGGKEDRRGEDRKAHPQRDASKLFERLDVDGNGSLSEEEFAQMLEMGRKHRGPRG